jgi:hypothetical protein
VLHQCHPADQRESDGLIPIVILVIAIAAVILVVRSFGMPGSRHAAGRIGRIVDTRAPGPAPRQPTLDTLRPRDAVSFWDSDDEVVESVVECQEEIGGRTSRWRWVILNGGRTIEVAPDENALYEHSTVYYPEPFYALTADPAEGGALKTFEARVRQQAIAQQPVTVTLDGTTWTVESTGTFLATFLGDPPKSEVWRDISSNPSDNVYFELRGLEDAMALGIWTTHVLVLRGRRLEGSDIQNIYPGAEEGAQA